MPYPLLRVSQLTAGTALTVHAGELAAGELTGHYIGSCRAGGCALAAAPGITLDGRQEGAAAAYPLSRAAAAAARRAWNSAALPLPTRNCARMSFPEGTWPSANWPA